MVKLVHHNPIPPEKLRLTMVYENNPGEEGFAAAWGFSCLVEGLEEPILFDSGGDPEVLEANMDRLGVAAGDVRHIVLSHIHWDHVTGMDRFLNPPMMRNIYVLKSFPPDLKQKLGNSGGKVIELEKPAGVGKGAYSTGPMGLGTREQALLIPTSDGIVVIAGCAHPGPVAVVKRAMKLLERKVLLLAGGLHLLDASRVKVKRIISDLQHLGVNYVAPGHCTGKEAQALFRKAYGERCLTCAAGWRISFNARLEPAGS
ncbi:MAG: MBL fold metallo-hydrolase [Planctomycetota bacterium]|jgi:7,8-dihydropterin-6-yl-methyl-4-(beta-D-ribofuranosyl)aminobenzene 5'-phosphate synthase